MQVTSVASGRYHWTGDDSGLPFGDVWNGEEKTVRDRLRSSGFEGGASGADDGTSTVSTMPCARCASLRMVRCEGIARRRLGMEAKR